MTYRIVPLPRASFAPWFALGTAELARKGARRIVANADRGFPCRVSLEDARAGESVLLVNHVSHETPGPYRTAYAIYVRETAAEAAPFVDRLPPVFAGRVLSLRGFDSAGMLVAARLAGPGQDEAGVEAGIAGLFEDPRIACIHAHNAAYGCYAARIERHGEGS